MQFTKEENVIKIVAIDVTIILHRKEMPYALYALDEKT